tara:strand:- start:310 stop:528 length:219 start_codon:yes stop_codon:yes gene_type:complete
VSQVLEVFKEYPTLTLHLMLTVLDLLLEALEALLLGVLYGTSLGVLEEVERLLTGKSLAIITLLGVVEPRAF